MEALRDRLGRLGWPIDQLSDDDIGNELYRRWFENLPQNEEGSFTASIASGMGIVAALAKEGNLDALCWSNGDEHRGETEPLEEAFAPFEGGGETPPRASDERRRHRRERAATFVTWRERWFAIRYESKTRESCPCPPLPKRSSNACLPRTNGWLSRQNSGAASAAVGSFWCTPSGIANVTYRSTPFK